MTVDPARPGGSGMDKFQSDLIVPEKLQRLANLNFNLSPEVRIAHAKLQFELARWGLQPGA
jgi:hypothetical protein